MAVSTAHRSGHGSARARARRAWYDVRLRWREFDVEAVSPRIASAVFLVAGLLALCSQALLPLTAVDDQILPSALAAVVLGVAGVVAPWPRWSRRAQLVIPFSAFAIVAAGGLHGDVAAPFLAILPLPFVFVGFTQRRGTSLAIAPLAAAALVIGGRFDFTPMLIAALVFALPVSVLVGEAIAQVELRRAHAERRIGRLLEAVRVLASVDDAGMGAHIVASLASELLDADAVAVYLADRPRSSTFRNRASFGHPAVADAAPLVIDARVDPDLLRADVTTFLADASATPMLDAPGAAGRLRSAAVVPLPGADGLPLGVVLAMWGSGLRRLSGSARQAAELLSQEAGPMFSRLHEKAVLAHDAETDPLTELANRRTFARALETLRPGDAVVIVDLDHFKSVNDRFGHQLGDRTLRTLATCLRRATRQVDCVARYGGEEFAMVLPAAGSEGAHAALDRVRKSWSATDAVTTFSSGVAVHEPGDDALATLGRADIALYRAKELGRDRDVLAPVDAEITL